MPIAPPSMFTSGRSLMVPGLVRKKKPSVMWKSEREVTMVFVEMSGMLAVAEPLLFVGVRGRSTKYLGDGSGLPVVVIGRYPPE